MSFFKDFKGDLSQAVNELITDETTLEDDEMVNTLDQDEMQEEKQQASEGILNEDGLPFEAAGKEPEEADGEAAPEVQYNPKAELPENNNSAKEPELEIKKNNEVTAREELPVMQTEDRDESFVDESAVITKGMTIIGNVESKGSVEVVGIINGDILSKGKIIVTGEINGNSKANEFFADSAKINGEINCEGSVKIGQGSVVVGNITGTSVVIAGAVNGDIDVKGPVIVDASAVVVGNIKSRSVQINNGAIIEGFCSQSYAEVNVKSIFGEDKNTTKENK